MWKLSRRGPRGTPFEDVGNFASIAEAAEKICAIEPDEDGWIFFIAAVSTWNDEPESDAKVLSHLTYQARGHYYILDREAN